MRQFTFSSTVSPEHRETLEGLLFFNAGQEHVRDRIIEVVRRYGAPRICERQSRLVLEVPGFPDAQSLLVLTHIEGESERLCGAMIYVRENADCLLLLHIAVLEDYSAEGKYHDQGLLYRMVNKLREIGRSIKGVCYVAILYAPGSEQRIHV